ncbi:MAG: high frequency lysogenization protein [Pseudohongiellaceae bacterium]
MEPLLNNSSAKYSKWEQEIIALAAVAQCAALVDVLATKGSCSQADLAASINPLLVLKPLSYDDVFPNVVDQARGLRTLTGMFSNDRSREKSDVVRYTLGLLQLRSLLMQDDEMQQQIGSGLVGIPPLQMSYFSSADEESDSLAEQDQTIDQLASLYRDTISSLSYRIQVQGRSDHLKNETIAKQIRALLLAGIRAAVLWHQVGGRRWRLLIYRSRIQQSADGIRKRLLN